MCGWMPWVICAGCRRELTQDAPRLLIGSHLDTVPNAGAFDGVLGVVMGVALVEELQGKRLPFAIEVIGFSEEEGVRFQQAFSWQPRAGGHTGCGYRLH